MSANACIPVVTRDQIQEEVVSSLFAERGNDKRSTLFQMPTQTGKTRTACKYIRQLLEQSASSRVLVCAHMGELLDQWGRELDAMGVPYVVEKAQQKALHHMQFNPEFRVCLGSKDTLQNRGKTNRLAQWPEDYFTDVLFDECHLATADTWKNVRDHFSQAFVVGMTATIDRLDGVPLATVFDSTAYTYEITEAIRNGHRVPFHGVSIDTTVDIRGIRANRIGAFAAGEVEARIAPQLEEIGNLVRQHLERLGIRKAIAFLPDRASAYLFAQTLTRLGISSKGVCGENPDRKGIIEAHRRGDFRVLCNKKLLGMGYNDPGIEAVIHLQPTTSRSWYDQMSGRCGATKEGKEKGYLIYCGWESDLDLIGPTDIFAAGSDPRVADRARRKARSAKDVDPQALLEQAQREIAEEDRRKAAKAGERQLRFLPEKRNVRHRYREFDPIGVTRRAGIQVADSLMSGPGDPVLVQRLSDLGYRDVRGLSDSAMEAVLGLWEDRMACGMSTFKQFDYLVCRRNFDPGQVLRMTNKEASQIIGQLHTR